MKLPKIFRRQPTLEEAIEHLTIEGYVGQSPDGDFYITQKGLDNMIFSSLDCITYIDFMVIGI